jgi:hypothetical protein
LRSQYIGTGAYGFAISVPRQFRDGAPHRVDVVVADAGVLLKHGRLRLADGKLTALK